MTEERTHVPLGALRAQLRSDSGRSSKVIKDREAIEAVVEVAGAGKLVLRVDSAGGFSLRGRPDVDEADEAARRDLLAVGVMRADGIVAFRPEGDLLRNRAQGELKRRLTCSLSRFFIPLFTEVPRSTELSEVRRHYRWRSC
jgi:hypothetical protein